MLVLVFTMVLTLVPILVFIVPTCFLEQGSMTSDTAKALYKRKKMCMCK